MDTGPFLEFIRLVVSGPFDEVARVVKKAPTLATVAANEGATRGGAVDCFFDEIKHYLYRGDTALHMAAAAFWRPVAELLVAHGALCQARNRRGAEPLHYAADAHRWNPDAQAETISCLTSVGAGIPGITGHRAVHVAGPVEGRVVLVQGGAGAVGQCAVAMARHAGARVIATVRSEADGAEARAGAHEVV